jgi:hypothetical protein
LQLVTDPAEKARAASEMVRTAQQSNLSTNFLHAHGFAKTENWSALASADSLVIVKLVDVSELSGLKSP